MRRGPGRLRPEPRPDGHDPGGGRTDRSGRRLRYFELGGLYGILPAVFLFPLARFTTVVLILAAFVYVLGVSWWTRTVSRRTLGFNGSLGGHHWSPILVRFLLFAVVTTTYVALTGPEALFWPPRFNRRLWGLILLIYCGLSVYPQEFVFRTFFFSRYRDLFPNDRSLIIANAALFAWAHNIIPHPVVYIATFAGGLLFAWTYHRSRSLLVVTIEHSLYGFWLFTVGLGSLFAFPGP